MVVVYQDWRTQLKDECGRLWVYGAGTKQCELEIKRHMRGEAHARQGACAPECSSLLGFLPAVSPSFEVAHLCQVAWTWEGLGGLYLTLM